MPRDQDKQTRERGDQAFSPWQLANRLHFNLNKVPTELFDACILDFARVFCGARTEFGPGETVNYLNQVAVSLKYLAISLSELSLSLSELSLSLSKLSLSLSKLSLSLTMGILA
ncbi:hypothetical protein GMLC_30730 [Geomonas limicola]|uniref:Uncharacterized protein n=1 Tax=Geomonas limicola TaxID=2740186 RepID=A0A6V8NC93_9BACT|nr:hypothetical protein GMLC_30730 [Geomonas limicola]